MLPFLFLVAALVSCGQANKPEPPKSTTAAALPYSYDQAVARTATFLDGSDFIVSRRGAEEKNQGDAMFFTATFVSAVACQDGERAVAALLRMPPELWRHQTLAGQGVSLDALLAFYKAAAYRITKCGELERWRPFLAEHSHAFTAMPDYFWHVRDRLYEVAGLESAKEAPTQRKLEFEAGEWARAVIAAKEPCFRVNLGLIAFETLELLGDEVGGGEFCSATKSADLRSVDAWCGRDGLREWAESYVPNVWQYAFQRCPAWESESPGDDQPGIDYLVALKALEN